MVNWKTPVLAAVCLAASSQLAIADAWTLRPIIATGDTLPGGMIFQSANAEANVNGELIFAAQGGLGYSGIFKWDGAAMTRLVDTTMPAPGGMGTFASFTNLSYDGSNLVFAQNTAASGSALFELNGNGSIHRLVDSSTPMPGSSDTFSGLGGYFSVNGSVVAFEANNPSGKSGIYRIDTAGISTVADINTANPSGQGPFNYLGTARSSTSGIAFIANGVNSAGLYTQGIYLQGSNGITALVDTTVPYPDGGHFQGFSDFSIDGSDLADSAGANSTGVMFKIVNGVIYNVADFKDPAPGFAVPLTYMGTVSLKNGSVAFLAGDNTREGLLSDYGDSLLNVIESGDVLDGKIVQYVSITDHSFDGSTIAVNVNFTDGTSGLFVATVPEPSWALLPLAGATTLLTRKRSARDS